METIEYGGTKYRCFIPKNVNADTPVLVYFDGAGTTSAGMIQSSINAGTTNSDYVIVCVGTNSNVNTTYDFVTNLQSNLGITNPVIDSTSYSAGSRKHLKFVLRQIEQNPSSVPRSITLLDSYGVNGANNLNQVFRISNEELNTIASHVDNISYYGRASLRKFLVDFETSGMDVSVKFMAGSHYPGVIQKALDTGLFNEAVGESNFSSPSAKRFDYYLVIDRSKLEGMTAKQQKAYLSNWHNWKKVTFEEYKAMMDRGEITPDDFVIAPEETDVLEEDITSEEETTESNEDNNLEDEVIILDGVTNLEGYIANLDDYASQEEIEGFPNVSEVRVKAQDWYVGLRYLEDLKIDGIPDRLYADISYVLEQMNALRGMVKNSNFLYNAQTISFGNSSSIPGCFAAYVNMYFNLVGKLMESLASETDAIVSVAALISDMDANLADMDPLDVPIRLDEPSVTWPTPTPVTGVMEETPTDEVIVEPIVEEPNKDVIVEPIKEDKPEGPVSEDKDKDKEKEIKPSAEDKEEEKIDIVANIEEEPIKKKTPYRSSSPNTSSPSQKTPTKTTTNTNNTNNTTPVEEPSNGEEVKPQEDEVVVEPVVTPTEPVEEPTKEEPNNEVEPVKEEPSKEETIVTPAKNKTSKNSNTKKSSSSTKSSSKTNSNSNKTNNEPVIEPNNEVVNEMPEYEEPGYEIPVEEPVVEPEVKPAPVHTETTETKKSGASDVLKTVGIAAAVGATLGGAAYGVSEHIKDKKYRDEEYENIKTPSENEFVEEESDDDSYTPFE